MTGLDLPDVPDPSGESGTRSVIERIRLEHIARRFGAPFFSSSPFPVEYRFCVLWESQELQFRTIGFGSFAGIVAKRN
jgi:hypothetical protein